MASNRMSTLLSMRTKSAESVSSTRRISAENFSSIRLSSAKTQFGHAIFSDSPYSWCRPPSMEVTTMWRFLGMQCR
jgi:hypothetical protein